MNSDQTDRVGFVDNGDARRRTLTILWVALLIVAAALRFGGLGAAVLDSAEAEQALASYNAASGTGPGVGSLSPLLYNLNLVMFALLSESDALARLLPAMAGVGLVAVPLLLRRRLGEFGAFGMALTLAISPTALFFSRKLDGTIPAVLGVAAAVGFASRYLETWRPAHITWVGLSLAFAISAGPASWGMLVGLVLGLTAVMWIWWDEFQGSWADIRVTFGRGLLALGAGLLAFSGGIGLNLAGLSASGEQFIGWLARFGDYGGFGLSQAMMHLMAYETLILLMGLVGVVLVVRNRRLLGLLLVFWTGLGLIQLVLMDSRMPGDLMWMLVPMAALGGFAIEELVVALRTHGRWFNEGLYLPISMILWAHSAMSLSRYARGGETADLMLVGLTVLFQVLLVGAFGFAIAVPEEGEPVREALGRGLKAALRAGGLSFGLVLVLTSFATGWGLAHLRATDPRELPVIDGASEELRILTQVAERVRMLNDSMVRRVALVGPTPVSLDWALREFEVEHVDSVPSDWFLAGAFERPELMVAVPQAEMPEGYFGEMFTVRRDWNLLPRGQEMARWLLYREPVEPVVVADQVVLWVLEDVAPGR